MEWWSDGFKGILSNKDSEQNCADTTQTVLLDATGPEPEAFGSILRNRFRKSSEMISHLGDELRGSSKDGRQDFLSADVEKIHLAIKDFRAIVEKLTDLSNLPEEINGLVSETYSVLSGSRNLPVYGDGVTSGMRKKVSAHSASILVVDDHPLNRELLSRLIKRQGHVVQT